MHSFIHTFLLTYLALFPIVNPVGNTPLFLSLTRLNPAHDRSHLPLRVAVNCFLLLLGSLLLGSYVLVFFGINLPVVRVAGGLVVAAFGWKMLNSGVSIEADAAAAAAHPVPRESVDAFYPLTLPMTVGPGAISTAIALGSQRPAEPGVMPLLIPVIASIAAIAALAATIFLCYRFAEGMFAKLGHGGTNVVVRMSAFILLCIGVQIIWAGWSELSAMPH